MGWGYCGLEWAPGLAEARPIGYGVEATCDSRWCSEEIDRGLGYICGEMHHDPWGDEPGCGRYFCEQHLGWFYRNGVTCSHRGKKTWGETLACMIFSEADNAVCLYRKGHDGDHAWKVERGDPTLPWDAGGFEAYHEHLPVR